MALWSIVCWLKGALRGTGDRPKHLSGWIFHKEVLPAGINPLTVYEIFITISEMRLRNHQEIGWRCRLWSCLWVKGLPQLFDMHAMGDPMLQHRDRLWVSYIFLCFDHCLLPTRSMPHFLFFFYSAPLQTHFTLSDSVKTQLGHSTHSTCYSHLFMLHA